MKKHLNLKLALLLVAVVILLPLSAKLKADAANDSGMVTTTVTAVAKKENQQPPNLSQGDVTLYQGKERVQIADWQRGGPLFLALLIDDSLDPVVGNQWNDLKAFLAAQPNGTYIAVAYARNGAAMLAQDFTQDRALASKALRLPLGNAGAFTSPYLALQDWIKRWPDSNSRKSIMLFSSGVDYFRGGFDPIDPDLDSTIGAAQKKNINVWSIYVPDAGHLGRRGGFRAFNSQSNLSRLSEETGAEAYYLGFGMPVTLKPYFDEIQMHLNNQYLLTFLGNGGKKGKFERVRVTTEVKDVEFLTPSEVFLPAVQ